MHHCLESKIYITCLNFQEILHPQVSKLFIIIECHKLLTEYFLCCFKTNPFAMLASCSNDLFTFSGDIPFFIYFDLNKFTKFYLFLFQAEQKRMQKKHKTKTEKKPYRNNHNK